LLSGNRPGVIRDIAGTIIYIDGLGVGQLGSKEKTFSDLIHICPANVKLNLKTKK
jgi:hypothetical protein